MRKEDFTVWHEGAEHFSDSTTVYFVGECTVRIIHVCDGKEKELRMYIPMAEQFATTYCKNCDTMYIGKESND